MKSLKYVYVSTVEIHISRFLMDIYGTVNNIVDVFPLYGSDGERYTVDVWPRAAVW